SASADRCPAAVSSSVKQVFILAYINACKSGQAEMRSLNLILPIVKQDKNLLEILYDLEIDENKIINTIKWFEIDNILLEDYKIYQKSAKLKPGTTMDRAYTAISTPVLDSISYDLTLMAKQGRLEFCVNRDKEIQEIFQVLESERCGALLTGSVGTGKRAIINGIARLMVREKVPKFLKDKRLIELDAARLISGADAVMAEERLLVIIDEINKAGNIILFIENIENIVGISSGQEQSLELSEVLTGAINRKELYCLATVEAQNYVRYIEGKPLGNAMSIIKIQEPNINQAIQMIESKINRFENKYQIYFSYNSIEQAVQLSSKYINDKYLPEKAINILEATAVRLSGQRLQNAQKYMCSKNDIAETISKITGIPLSDITDIESEKLLNLEKYIHKRMINQNEAVNMVSDSLRRARAALNSGKRPIANFLFLGPTGVGKTELAKTVAEVYFGNENYMIRLDMSEYQHADSIEKMIGSAGGIKGQLTEAVRKQPFSLILLDEFEKSHPDILNLFLQVMDDGRLTDGQGNTINFTNSIIIATSNAGALYIQEQIANNHGLNIDMQKLKQTLINEHLNKIMRPELINRFDGVIVFKPLTIENIRVITKLMLKKIVKALEAKGIGMKMEEQGIYKLAQEGYDPKFGARPLRRLLQDKIANQIAKKILSKELARRDIVIINEIGGVDIEKAREL
ncbi:ATP-dependent Clp protease ATP-binding subunit, partial [Patescibacteria group bacterium]|nr:ATP-dependent Clp protease ATP-binding subunit [Patescibacteria group bacterium]